MVDAVAVQLDVAVRRQFRGGPLITGSFEMPVERPQVTVLFGPSGSGKTTLLRCVAGLERPDDGRVAYGDDVWSDTATGQWVPPQRRRIGFLDQDYALFPRRTVTGNVAFGLRRLSAQQQRSRVAELLERFGLTDLAARRPGQLSGGQRQRVALARALAPNPRLLMLDEPLSALDAPTRRSLRTELRSLLMRTGVPSLLVTHDRAEALALGDRMMVVIDGRIVQTGSVEQVFGRPANQKVAAAVGVENVLSGRITERRDGLAAIDVGGCRLVAVDSGTEDSDVLACFRAEEVLLRLADSQVGESARNHLPATVIDLARDGPLFRVSLDCGFQMSALVTVPARDEMSLRPGSQVVAVLKAPSIHLVPRPTEGRRDPAALAPGSPD
ncbi:MAG: ABC transporter ATP-binding protein [Actinomycetota bacterium]